MKPLKVNKILLGYSEIAGYQSNLFSGLVSNDQIVGYVNNSNVKFDYEFPESNNHPKLNKYNAFCKRALNNPTFINKIAYVFYTFYILLFTIFFYDIFVINRFCFFYKLEIKLLKLFNKKIIFISLGSSTRPPYLNGSYKDDLKNKEFNSKKILKETNQIRKKVQFIENNVDLFVNYPQHGHFNSKPFINGMHIGFPTIIKENLIKRNKNEVLKILHAPSRPNAKGSESIKKIIQSLQKEGLNIELVELINVSNSKVLNQIEKSDIIFDEIYSDMPLGGLGTEAAQFSKPVILGGYYTDFFKEYDSKIIPPSIYVHPDNLENSLKELCLNENKRIKIGKELNDFVKKNWNNEVVALKYLKLINNHYDNRWNYDPKIISNFNGWGISEKEMKNNIKKMIQLPGGKSNLAIFNYDTLDEIIK